MKRQHNATIFARVVALSVMLGIVYQVACGENKQFNFDSIYPKNFCTKATEQCVKVWGAWDRLINAKTVSSVHIMRTIDRSIGQLVLAQRFLVTVLKGEKKTSPEHMHYLSRVVGTIADRFEKLPHMDHDRSTCLKEYIIGIKKLVEQNIKQ